MEYPYDRVKNICNRFSGTGAARQCAGTRLWCGHQSTRKGALRHLLQSFCRAAFNRGVALLHSFWFSASIEGFNEVLQLDPSCVMANWGIAMSEWGNPFAASVRPGH